MNPAQQPKDFGLSQQEMLIIQQNQNIANSIMGVFLSYLVTSRFGYQVTQNTRFEVRDGRLYVTEEEAPNSQQPQTDENKSQLETA